MTGIFCNVLLDIEDVLSVDDLAVSRRDDWRSAGKAATDDVRGGTVFVLSRLLWRACGGRFPLGWLVGGTSSNIAVRPVSAPDELPPLAALEGALASRPCLIRNFACFFFSPCSRLMMISRIRGRNRSRLWGEASWLSVSSRIERRRSGTGPRSEVSTPIELKARQARLNS